MEAVGSASAILELARAGVSVIKYCNEVRHAPEAARKLLVEVEELSKLLTWLADRYDTLVAEDPAKEQLQTLFVQDAATEKWVYGPLLTQTDAIFQEIRTSLEWQETAVAKEGQSVGRKLVEKAKTAYQALKWPFSQVETEKKARLLRQLHQQIAIVTGQAQFDLVHETFSNTQSVKQQQIELFQELTYLRADQLTVSREVGLLRTRQEREDFDELLSWICPYKTFQPKQRNLEDVYMRSKWLIEQEYFDAWQSGKSWSLTIWAPAGFGKTVLMTDVASHLQNLVRGDASRCILSLYLKHEDQATQKCPHLLASLLRQLVLQQGPEHCSPEIVDFRKQNRGLSRDKLLEQVSDLLEEEIVKQTRTYILIDGLDEAQEDTRTMLLDAMRSLQRVADVSLLFSSRQMEVNPFRHDVQCDHCSEESLIRYLVCKADKQHEDGYALCPRCAEGDEDCAEDPHDLYEPYDNININYRTPNSVIADFIQQLIVQQKKIGVDDSQQAKSAASAGWSYSSVRQTRLGRHLGRWQELEPGLENSIVSEIVEASNGSLMLAHMQWQHVKRSPSVRDVKRALRTLPREFTTVYDKAMERITKQAFEERELGIKVIMWISQSKRVLGLEELQHALSVDFAEFESALGEGEEDADGTVEDGEVFDKTYLIDEYMLLSVTAGLVTVAVDGSVRLMHRSAYDYFNEPDNIEKWFPKAHYEMAMASLAYLTSTAAKTPCLGENDDTLIEQKVSELPFATYAAQYWGFHAAMAQSQERTQLAVRRFIASKDRLASAVQLAYFYEDFNSSGWDVRKGVNVLHVLAWFGLHRIIDKYDRFESEMDSPDHSIHGRTPLGFACLGGDENTIEFLLRKGAKIAFIDRDGKMPIGLAISRGHTKAVAELCKWEQLPINNEDETRATALMDAVNHGKPDIVKILFGREDLDINHQRAGGYSALICAVFMDSAATLQALLKHPNLVINMTDDYGHTALHHAADNGKVEFVHELLKSGADLHLRGAGGETALLMAVGETRDEVVQYFLKRHDKEPILDAAHKDDRGEGLLYNACSNDMQDLVDWLLDNGFDPNVQNVSGFTPLHITAETDNFVIAEKLLSNGADRSLRSDEDETAADIASMYGYEELADLLRPQNEDRSAEKNELPTWVLAARGLDQLLRERVSIDDKAVLAGNSDGVTPLQFAVRNGHLDCVRILLDAGEDMDVTNAKDRFNRTPVFEACYADRHDALDLLLSHRPPPDLGVTDISNDTPLRISVRREDDHATLRLIAAGADPAMVISRPDSLVEAAIEADDSVSMQCLVEAGIEVKDKYRRQAKLRGGTGEIIQLLIKNKTFREKKSLETESEDNVSQINGEPESISQFSIESTAPPPEASIPQIDQREAFKQRSLSRTLVTTSATISTITGDVMSDSPSSIQWPTVPTTGPAKLDDLENLKATFQAMSTSVDGNEAIEEYP